MGSSRKTNTPLVETGEAPRILVTGVDRIERLASGLYCLVCTVTVTSEGQPERRVNLYLDATASAIASGISQALTEVAELGGAKLLTAFRSELRH